MYEVVSFVKEWPQRHRCLKLILLHHTAHCKQLQM